VIRLAEVRRFAAQQHVDVAVAVQEVVLTILLRRIALSPRRSENRNPKDIWDLWKWFSQCHPADAQLVRLLWPARLWLDGLAGDTRWREPGWIERLDVRRFNWDRLRPLVPAYQRLQADQIVTELKARIRPWVDDNSDGVLSDVGDGHQHARLAVQERIRAVQLALGPQ
jgi:hypothetical protein